MFRSSFKRLAAVLLAAVAPIALGCGGPTGPADGVADFDAAWAAVDSVYPFLDFKQIDWHAVYADYRPRARQASGADALLVVLDMLGELRDGHAKLTPPPGIVLQLRDGWVQNDDGAIWHEGERGVRDRDVWDASVLFNYITRDSIRVNADSTVGWAVLDNGLGYIRLAQFHPHSIIQSMHAAVDYVRNSPGLIVDVRHNTGGNGDTIREFVSRFLADPMPGLVYYIRGESDRWPDLQPGGAFQYTRPTVVLINGKSFSGAEAFAELMKQVPHVTVVGDTTGGGGGGVDNSAPGIFQLPSGAELQIPTVDLRRYDGLPWEWLGIAPDVRVTQTEADLAGGRDRQLEAAIAMLR